MKFPFLLQSSWLIFTFHGPFVRYLLFLNNTQTKYDKNIKTIFFTSYSMKVGVGLWFMHSHTFYSNTERIFRTGSEEFNIRIWWEMIVISCETGWSISGIIIVFMTLKCVLSWIFHVLHLEKQVGFCEIGLVSISHRNEVKWTRTNWVDNKSIKSNQSYNKSDFFFLKVSYFLKFLSFVAIASIFRQKYKRCLYGSLFHVRKTPSLRDSTSRRMFAYKIKDVDCCMY